MLVIYQEMASIGVDKMNYIVIDDLLLKGAQIRPDKLRMNFVDGSFLDVWLSVSNDYSYHWERRKQKGEIYRWDNAHHHPEICTFLDHFYEGNQLNIVANSLPHLPKIVLWGVLVC